MKNEEMLKKVEALKPSTDFLQRREETIKNLGYAFDSREARVIVAMTDAFFIEGKFMAADFINELLESKGL